MKKKIIFGLVVIIIIVFGVINFWPKPETQDLSPEPEPVPVYTETPTEMSEADESARPTAVDPKTEAWTVFGRYLAFNKDLDLDGVKSVVHKVAAVCNTAEPTDECKTRMTSAYSYGSEMNQADFVNVWNDGRQVILATDFWTEKSEDMNFYGRFRSLIIFIRGSDGKLRLLNFSPLKGGSTSLDSADSAELDERLIIWTEDKDQDGLADYEEECLHKPNDKSCVKTDPKKRDTNGDGWWDGVNALF